MEMIGRLERNELTETQTAFLGNIGRAINQFRNSDVRQTLYQYFSKSPVATQEVIDLAGQDGGMDSPSFVGTMMEHIVRVYMKMTGDTTIKHRMDVQDRSRLRKLFRPLYEMKILRIKGGIAIPVNNEELELIDKIKDEKKTSYESLSEREQELAFRLTSRGLLKRSTLDDKIFYAYNGLDDVWRD